MMFDDVRWRTHQCGALAPSIKAHELLSNTVSELGQLTESKEGVAVIVKSL